MIGDLAEAIDAIAQIGWALPTTISQDSAIRINAGIPDGPIEPAALKLWKAATPQIKDPSEAAYLMVKGASEDSEKLSARLDEPR